MNSCGACGRDVVENIEQQNTCKACLKVFCGQACKETHKDTCGATPQPLFPKDIPVVNVESEELKPVYEQVLQSSELAGVLADPEIQAKITGILESDDAESMLKEAIKEDPHGVGKVANLIRSIIDQNQVQ